MNFLLHFFLAHFLSDYPFQSGQLVKLKMERYLGVFLHTAIHLASMLVIFYPLLHERKVQIAIAIVYITHNIIDQAKAKLDKNDPKHHRLYYFLDQFLHWSIIVGVAKYVGNSVTPNLTAAGLDFYMNQNLWLYFVLMVVTTYFYDVSRYFATLKVTKVDYIRDYKTMIRNGVIVTIAFGVYWLAY